MVMWGVFIYYIFICDEHMICSKKWHQKLAGVPSKTMPKTYV